MGVLCTWMMSSLLETFADHLNHLREVFLQLKDAGLCLKPQKCKLLRKEVLFLGHVITH